MLLDWRRPHSSLFTMFPAFAPASSMTGASTHLKGSSRRRLLQRLSLQSGNTTRRNARAKVTIVAAVCAHRQAGSRQPSRQQGSHQVPIGNTWQYVASRTCTHQLMVHGMERLACSFWHRVLFGHQQCAQLLAYKNMQQRLSNFLANALCGFGETVHKQVDSAWMKSPGMHAAPERKKQCRDGKTACLLVT